MAKANLGNFEYMNRLKFATVMRYTTDHDPELTLEPGYFNSAGQYLNAGDEVDVVCRHEDGSWIKGRLEVVAKTETEITVEQLGQWRSVGAPAARTMKMHFVPSNKTWMVKASDGSVIAKGLPKAEAAAMVGA